MAKVRRNSWFALPSTNNVFLAHLPNTVDHPIRHLVAVRAVALRSVPIDDRDIIASQHDMRMRQHVRRVRLVHADAPAIIEIPRSAALDQEGGGTRGGAQVPRLVKHEDVAATLDVYPLSEAHYHAT
jgi:hypothetical protein